MDQAALLGAIQAVVSGVEIADQSAGKRFLQDTDDDIPAAVAVDEEQGQPRVAEAPYPGGLAIDATAGFVLLNHGGLAEQLEKFIDHRSEGWPPQRK